MKSLLLLLVLSLVYFSNEGDDDYIDDHDIITARCPDKKAKTNVCSYNFKSSSNSRYYEFLIFKKCGKGQKCSDHKCVDDTKYKKNGQSCNFNNDCISGYCDDGKCGGLKEGDICEDTEGRTCGTGLSCSEVGTSNGNTVYKCAKTVNTVGGAITEGKTECGKGLIADAQNKCQKWGSIEDKKPTTNSLLCKSGLSHDGICDSIETEPICEYNPINPMPIIKTAGKWGNGDALGVVGQEDYYCRHETDYNGNDRYYYKYSKIQSKLFADFLEDYNDLDLEEINTKDKYAGYFPGNLKWKTYQKYLLYENAGVLKEAGLIDGEGKMVDDKKCEYNFVLKHLSSNTLQVGGLFLALISLLF